ncbi:hypothetical protein BDFB_011586 [Asbolus verrucosus]|uniref:Uncharacterized protein n=1 Tax=Asbolus verrucosus TaxID=1661398 RepID=A0A482V0L6_ASBVE|nr:hypothetical protein BDFB_011586 [Asbolus verrucosus]
MGLCSYRPRLVFPLTQNHQHLESCTERRNWDHQWRHVIFSDESRICLGVYNGGQRVRRLGNLPHPPTNLQELQHAVLTAWKPRPQEFINKAIESMPRSIQDFIAERVDPTHY